VYCCSVREFGNQAQDGQQIHGVGGVGGEGCGGGVRVGFGTRGGGVSLGMTHVTSLLVHLHPSNIPCAPALAGSKACGTNDSSATAIAIARAKACRSPD
jgi:hypothetical protein